MDMDIAPEEFLERIRALGDKRDREDEERMGKLEEEILAGREARQARRAGEKLAPEHIISHYTLEVFFFIII